MYKLFFKIVIVFLGSLFYLNCQGQSFRDVIDAKNGFKNFQIGDSKAKWLDSMVFAQNGGIWNMYDYNGNCCKKMFEVKISKINLIFSAQSSKLVGIILRSSKHRPSADSLDMGQLTYYYQKDFYKAFGDAELVSTEEIKMTNGKIYNCTKYIWSGEKIVIEMKVFYSRKYKGEGYSVVTIADKLFVAAGKVNGF